MRWLAPLIALLVSRAEPPSFAESAATEMTEPDTARADAQPTAPAEAPRAAAAGKAPAAAPESSAPAAGLLPAPSAAAAPTADAAPPSAPAALAPAAASTVLYAGQLSPACADLGWAPRKLGHGPASLDFSSEDGWMISCEGLEGPFRALRFRVRAEEKPDYFLEVQLDGSVAAQPTRVPIAWGALSTAAGGWTQVELPLKLLNPSGLRFERVIFRAAHHVKSGRVEIDQIELAPADGTEPPAAKHSEAETSPERASARAEVAPRGQVVQAAPGAAARSHARAPAAAAPLPAPHAETPASAEAKALDQIPLASLPSAHAGRTRAFAVRCDEKSHPISPLIYGVAYLLDADDEKSAAWEIGATARRWGGNNSTRYNWKLGNAWNTANDWFFQNVNYTGKPGAAWKRFLEADDKRGVRSALTVPTLGWVAKDTHSYSFSVAQFGPQKAVAPENHDAGNGVSSNDVPLDPPAPAQTSVAATPEFMGDWIREVRALGGPQRTYILDNEPALWNSTHRDVHPEPVGYDELLEKTLAYAKAIRAADPDGLIAGPAEWGWANFFYSAKDLAGHRLRLDRVAHGGTPLLPWWLRKVAEEEQRSHTRLLDILDVHFYPQANVGIAASGGVDSATAALRIRSTRALWDKSYVDESWIAEPIELLPRLKRWVDEEHPGLGISIGEWNFGAEGHMSGGLAAAEALGRFGREGVLSAYYWTVPAARSPAGQAFRAYRNFDGHGGHFLNTSLAVEGEDHNASLFASREGNHLVAVLLNFDPIEGFDAEIDLSSCGMPAHTRVYSYAGGPQGFAEAPSALQALPGAARTVRAGATAYSMTVLDIELAP